MKRLIIIFLIFLLYPSFLLAQGPSTDPILRIETGMHTAAIIRIAIDQDERYLVTGSHDKTIRVWDLRNGRLIKTLRPPIESGKEGKIDAVAISPDGRYIAAGGLTGGEWDGSICIYIFELNSGRLIKRISGLPEVILHLTYSKDGRFLAAGLGLGGIRVFNVADYSLVKEDRDYIDSVYGLDFSKDGRLVTSSWDGYIRLYDKNFKLIAKEKAPGGKQPFGVNFSSDGNKIAVGYVDSPNIDILSGKNLSHLYSANTKGVSGCDLATPTFSSGYLYAGGGCAIKTDEGSKLVILRWADEGKGSFIDIPVADNTIMHILPLKGAGVVFGSAEPSFGVVDAIGRVLLYKKGETADYRNQEDKLLISYDGSKVRFGYKTFGVSPALFDIEKMELIRDGYEKNMLSPITESIDIKVTDWFYSYTPKLNGKPLKLEQYELSRSLAISPGGDKFLLGTGWYIRLYDRFGKELWRVPAPGTAWAVNISGNGKVAIAAFDDGTIRWYRMSDGKELLALFPHGDKKRWILWTPKGYYNTSPGGEDFIGWHINNGKEKEADFFPASRFRDRFYRPDIIAKLLSTYDEEKAIALANEKSGKKSKETSIKDILPPVVTILSPNDGTSISQRELTIRYAIRNPSKEPITGIKVLIDGRPISTQRGIQIKPKKGVSEWKDTVKVTVPESDFELSIIAENRFTSSLPYTVRLYWKGKKEEFIIRPKLYILAIGVSNYKDPSLKLQFAHKDAQDFVNTMLTQKGKLYEDVKVKLLTNEKATKEEILDGLEWLQRETTHKDVAMLFIAGHGINDQAGIYYFLPQNADLERLKRTGVPFSDIKNKVANIAGKVAMFVETCYAGGVMGKRATTDITGVINELTSAENGVVVFASSTGRQYSLEDPAWGNGAFTKALVEGLRGKADLLGKGKITINMLDAYVAERVKELTKGKQTPVTTKPQTVPDFPLAVK